MPNLLQPSLPFRIVGVRTMMSQRMLDGLPGRLLADQVLLWYTPICSFSGSQPPWRSFRTWNTGLRNLTRAWPTALGRYCSDYAPPPSETTKGCLSGFWMAWPRPSWNKWPSDYQFRNSKTFETIISPSAVSILFLQNMLDGVWCLFWTTGPAATLKIFRCKESLPETLN